MFHYVLALFLLSGIGLADKSSKENDETVPCVFREVKNCYQHMTNLGTNLTVEFARNARELNETCSYRKSSYFNSCLSTAEGACKAKIHSAIQDVQKLVNDLCQNGSVPQKVFLNSTKCWNANLQESKNCYFKYASNKTNDAKSLCCSVYHSKKCVGEKMRIRCPMRNSTALRERILNTFNEYADIVCSKYYKQCNGTTATIPASMWILSMVVAVLLPTFKQNM